MQTSLRKKRKKDRRKRGTEKREGGIKKNNKNFLDMWIKNQFKGWREAQ